MHFGVLHPAATDEAAGGPGEVFRRRPAAVPAVFERREPSAGQEPFDHGLLFPASAEAEGGAFDRAEEAEEKVQGGGPAEFLQANKKVKKNLIHIDISITHLTTSTATPLQQPPPARHRLHFVPQIFPVPRQFERVLGIAKFHRVRRLPRLRDALAQLFRLQAIETKLAPLRNNMLHQRRRVHASTIPSRMRLEMLQLIFRRCHLQK